MIRSNPRNFDGKRPCYPRSLAQEPQVWKCILRLWEAQNQAHHRSICQRRYRTNNIYQIVSLYSDTTSPSHQTENQQPNNESLLAILRAIETTWECGSIAAYREMTVICSDCSQLLVPPTVVPSVGRGAKMMGSSVVVVIVMVLSVLHSLLFVLY